MSAEIRELQESARQVVAGLGLAAEEQRAWRTITELGWLMVAAPEATGGLAMGLAGACALQTELGRGLVAMPLLPALMTIDAISCGSAVVGERWLELLMSGEDYVAASLGDTGILTAPHDAGFVLKGTLTGVASIDRASHVLVATDVLVALVPVAQLRLTEWRTWDETRRLADVHFDEVIVDSTRALATGSGAAALRRRLTVLRDFGLAADAVGGAAAALAMTVEYLQTRRQFGRPLAMFQVLKHRCADLKTMCEAAEALLQDNIARTGTRLESTDAVALAKASKQLACTTYAQVAEEAIQLHGGIGMTAEHSCHLFLKRALLNEQLGCAGSRCELDLADRLLRQYA